MEKSLEIHNAAFGILTALLLLHIRFFYHAPFFGIDDAYIILHNSAAYLSGNDPNYRGVPALIGSTSLVHTLLVALFSQALPPVWAMFAVQWAGIMLYALGVIKLAQFYRVSPLWSLALLFFVLALGYNLVTLLNGMEGSIAAAAIIWSLYFSSQARCAWGLPLLCGIMPFIRPELAVLSAPLMIVQAIRRVRQKHTQALFIDFALVLAIAAPLVLIYWHNTGEWLPSTINAKRYYFAESNNPFLLKLLSFFYAATLALPVAFPCFVLSAFLLGRTATGRACIVFVALFFSALIWTFPSSLNFNYGRYFYDNIPPLIAYGGILGLSHADLRARNLVRAALAAGVLLSVAGLPAEMALYKDGVDHTQYEMTAAVRFCREHIPPEAPVLVGDAGFIAWETPFNLIDFVGLKTPSSVPYHRKFTDQARTDRGKAIDAIARRSHVQYLVVESEWDSGFHISEGLKESGWTVETLRPPPVVNGVTPEHYYKVFRLALPSSA